MIYIIIKDWILPFFSGVIVPLIAVWIGARVTQNLAAKRAKREEKIQREKLLQLLKHEAELFKNHLESNGNYRSRKFITAQLILETPIFNINEHRKLIELILELLRVHDNIDLAVQFSSNVLSGTISKYTQPSLWITVAHYLESKFRKDLTINKMIASINKLNKQITEETTKDAEPIIEELLREVDRLLENN